jgi:hypothetical protein
MGKSNGITRIPALRGKKGAIKPKNLAAVVAAAALTSAPACAAPYTFTFNDEFGIQTTTKPIPGETAGQYATQVFGTNCVWSTASLGGCGGVANSTNFYIYQGNGLPIPATGATTDPSTQIVKVGGPVDGAIGGEFELAGSPGSSTFTNNFLALTGWAQSLDVTQQVASVYNLTDPLNGSVLYFQYRTGQTAVTTGTTTPFKFVSFDLHGATSAELQFTVEGFLGGVVKDSTVITLASSAFQTFTENWNNIDTVEIVSTSTLPVNWGSGTLYMDNIVIDGVTTGAVPETSTWVMMVAGFAGLGFMGCRQAGASGA